jgi:hypothetical protein
MRASFLSVRAFAASSLLAIVGIAACREGTTESVASGLRPGAVAGPRWVMDAAYAGCPTDVQDTCTYYHPGSTVSGYCAYGACFEMSYGEAIRVVAADELGAFPTVWFAWHRSTVAPTGALPCVVTQRGNKTRVDIPAPGQRCSVDLVAGETTYHEMFASNPLSGCLAWVECKQTQ